MSGNLIGLLIHATSRVLFPDAMRKVDDLVDNLLPPYSQGLVEEYAFKQPRKLTSREKAWLVSKGTASILLFVAIVYFSFVHATMAGALLAGLFTSFLVTLGWGWIEEAIDGVRY